MADDIGHKSIAVILSGTGSDGSRGSLAVNAASGFVIAQSPTESEFPGMPQSLIQTGIVDDILPASVIPHRIAKLLNNPIAKKIQQHSTPQDELDAILTLLREQFDIDFSLYKQATVLRRIERRMQVCHCGQFSDYLLQLHNDNRECTALRRELLIPVTRFFRDEADFELLKNQIHSGPDRQCQPRTWVAHLGGRMLHGEEAYSIAMLALWECLSVKKWVPIKIFATDVNPEAVDFAGVGKYPQTISTEIPSHLLNRYFQPTEAGYEVTGELRKTIVFAKHNLLTDPPFTNIDLAACRNTMIYLRTKAREVALKKLQYATRLNGYLFLGNSESLNVGEHNFQAVNTKVKMFKCVQRNVAGYLGNTE